MTATAEGDNSGAIIGHQDDQDISEKTKERQLIQAESSPLGDSSGSP
jgi:hypothetical protein